MILDTANTRPLGGKYSVRALFPDAIRAFSWGQPFLNKQGTECAGPYGRFSNLVCRIGADSTALPAHRDGCGTKGAPLLKMLEA